MIKVKEAKNIIRKNIIPLKPIQMYLKDALDYVLAENIISEINVPLYPQSFVDGYAFAFESLASNKALKIIGKIQAGDENAIQIKKGEAIRIFTGSLVPESTDTVVMQEHVTIQNETSLILNNTQLQKGDNVREIGAEIAKGELGLTKGTLIKPAAIGFLASIGKTHIQVYPKPSVSIIVTGNELQDIGKPLKIGQIYESNSHTTQSVLKQMGIHKIQIYKVEDSLEKLTQTLKNALHTSDIVLLTGGISVGEYDFVFQATENCGVEKIFHKVKQKPGKPIFFGKKEEKIVFGLPGNPASVLTCFYQYVTIALECLSKTKNTLKTTTTVLANNYTKPLGVVHFLKAYYDGSQVYILQGQESYKLNSYAKSNCLIELPENIEKIKTGEKVLIHFII